MGDLFEPKGEFSRRQLIYLLVAGSPVNTVIPLEDFETYVAADFRKNRSGLAEAIRDLQEMHGRTLVCVRGVGYRVALPSEHIGRSKWYSKAAGRRLKKGVNIAANTRRDELTPEQAAQLDRLEMTQRAVLDMTRRIDGRRTAEKLLEEARAQNRLKVKNDAG